MNTRMKEVFQSLIIGTDVKITCNFIEEFIKDGKYIGKNGVELKTCFGDVIDLYEDGTWKFIYKRIQDCS